MLIISNCCNLHGIAHNICGTSWTNAEDGMGVNEMSSLWSNFFEWQKKSLCVNLSQSSGWIIHVSIWTDFTGLDTYCAHLGRSRYVTCLQRWSGFVHHLCLHCFDCFHTMNGSCWRARIFAFAKAALYVEERCAAQCFSYWHIWHLQIHLEILNTWRKYLYVFLTSCNGTEVLLKARQRSGQEKVEMLYGWCEWCGCYDANMSLLSSYSKLDMYLDALGSSSLNILQQEDTTSPWNYLVYWHTIEWSAILSQKSVSNSNPPIPPLSSIFTPLVIPCKS